MWGNARVEQSLDRYRVFQKVLPSFRSWELIRESLSLSRKRSDFSEVIIIGRWSLEKDHKEPVVIRKYNTHVD